MRKVAISALLAFAPVLGLRAQDAAPPAPPATQQTPSGKSADGAQAAPDDSASKADREKAALATAAGKSQSPSGSKVAKSAPVDQKTYVIGAQDVLNVQVWQQEGLGCQCLVRPDGMISMPFLGDVQAGGRTPDELRLDISGKLKGLIKDPQVSVGLVEVRSKSYRISGEVLKPGEAYLVIPTTIMDALSSAGGFRDFADTKHIVIVRGKDRLRFNYNDVLKGKNLQQNIYLEPGDIIVVR